jgi:hypothetical protein
MSSSFAAALATANARIASLEVELNASRKAYDVAATAKASAEKSQKSMLGKAKKAKKALADANKEHAQWEQAVADVFTQCRLPLKVSALPCLLFSTSVVLLYLLTLVSSFLFYLLVTVQNLPGYPHRPCKQTMIL